MGFLRADAGSIHVAGQPVTSTRPPLSGAVAILPQDSNLLAQMPIARLLAYYAELGGLSRADARRESERVLGLVGLATEGGRYLETLSHGQRKRVGIAQTFLNRPRLILLDEPTTGLDPQVAHELRSTLRWMQQDHTIVISSHHLREVEELCAEVAILKMGRVVRQDSLENLVGSGE